MCDVCVSVCVCGVCVCLIHNLFKRMGRRKRGGRYGRYGREDGNVQVRQVEERRVSEGERGEERERGMYLWFTVFLQPADDTGRESVKTCDTDR